MPRMNPADLHKASHLVFDQKRSERWYLLPHVFELKCHGVTLDMDPSFRNICAVYKEVKQRKLPVELWKINNTTGRKTREYINPLFGEA